MLTPEEIAVEVAIHNGYYVRDRLPIPVDVVVFPTLETFLALRRAKVDPELIKAIGQTSFKAYPIDLDAYLLSAYNTGLQCKK